MSAQRETRARIHNALVGIECVRDGGERRALIFSERDLLAKGLVEAGMTLEHVEYALFKRSNGHQVGGPVRVREAADPRLRGLKPERYVIRRRPVYTGPWEDA